MKLHCHRPTLAAAFQIVSGVVPTRTTKDVLRNVKVHVADGRLTLIGTDTEVGIRYEIEGVESDSAGEFLLPTQRTSSILRELQDEFVDIETSDTSVTIRAVNSQFQLGAENPSEFPTVAAFADDAYFVIPAKELKQMIRRTVFATDSESTRYALGGVLWDFDKNTLTLAATDSRRLAIVQNECVIHGEPETVAEQPVIPAKAMSLLERSLADEGEVNVAIHSNDAVIRSGNITIYCRLVDGRFPRYRDVVPKEPAASINLVSGPLLQVVKLSQIMINEESRGVVFKFEDDQLLLVSQAAELGDSENGLPIAYSGESVAITLEPRFVADFLKVIDPAAQVVLQMTNSDQAVALVTDDQYTYVVMPLTRDR